MAYSDHLSPDQFSSYRSAYRRAQEIGQYLPTVSGSVSHNTGWKNEKRAAIRHLSRSSIPGEHLRGLLMIMTGSRGLEKGNSAEYDRDTKVIKTQGSLSGTVPVNRGRRSQADVQHELVHEVGHHQEPAYPDYSIAHSEALAENYAEKHRNPRLRYTKSEYDRSVIGVKDPAATDYRKTRRSKVQPGKG